jgi:Tol biopolymer transport system component
MPVLGGNPQQIVKDIDTSVSFSPDGKQFAFVRGDPANGVVNLVVANADGTNDHVIVKKKGALTPSAILEPAWSPDGKTIIFASTLPAVGGELTEVTVEGGATRSLFKTNGTLGTAHWLPDGNSLIVPMREQGIGTPGQLWTVAYPSGEAHRLTNDLTDYNLQWVDMTRDGSAIVTIEATQVLDLWASPGGDAAHSTQLTSGAPETMVSILSPTRLVLLNAGGEVHSADFDGQNQTLVAGAERHIAFISGCGDGKHIVYSVRGDTGVSIWRMDADGSNATQLTHGTNSILPLCAIDGQSFTYYNVDDGTNWRMAVDGGTPTQLHPKDALGPFTRLSKDNKTMMYTMGFPEAPQKRAQLAVMPTEGGEPFFAVDTLVGTTIGSGIPTWSPDGHSVDYEVVRGGAANLWRQPVGKGEAKQITNFPSGAMRFFVWSPDGKTLFTVRGPRSSDIILLQNKKE